MIWEVLFWSGAGIVFTAYVGYGLWVAALSRIRPADNQPRYRPDPELPRVTCVMAAANEAALIGRKIEILTQQDYPPEKLEIVVVSDGCTDATEAIVSQWTARDPRIRLLRTPRRSGKPTALNLARSQVVTEVMALMDVRQELPPNAVRDLVAYLAIPGVGAVSGDLQVRADRYWTYEGLVRKHESRSGSMVQVTGSLYALRTADFPEIPAETILDDVYVPLQIALRGGRIVMAEPAKSLDVVTRSVGSEFVRKVRTLAGLVQVCHLVQGCLAPRRNPVWARFLVHKLFRLVAPYGLLLMLAGAAMAQGWFYRSALIGAAALVLLAVGGSLGIRLRLASLSQSIVALNLAALWAVPWYYLGRASVTWARVEVDRT